MTTMTETTFTFNAFFITLNNLINNLGDENHQDEKKVNKIVKEWYGNIKTEYKLFLETNKQSTKNYVKNLDEKITEIKNIIIDMYLKDNLTDENEQKLVDVGIEFEEDEIELCKGCGECDGEEQYNNYCEECYNEKLGHYPDHTGEDEEESDDESEEEPEEEIIYIDNGLKTNTVSNISNTEMTELEQLKKRVAELEAEQKEKERQQKIAENKTEWFEKKYPEWIRGQEKIYHEKLLDLMKKNEIPDLWGVGGDWYESCFGEYYNEDKSINTNVTCNEILVKHINKAIGFRPKEEVKTDMKRKAPTKICRDSDKLFNDGEVLRHTATNGKTALNIIHCYYDKKEDKFELCSVSNNMLNEVSVISKLGHSFKNLNQFIIYNNKQYAPEKVQKETAWNGSVKLYRGNTWINTKDLQPL
jgi:hypothetical protein